MVSQCADIVKISVRGIPMPALERQVKALKAASSCDLLALHTETAAEHAACVAMGFTYFQGFFLHHPEMIPITRLSVSCSHGLRVLATILNPELDVGAFTEVISIDVGLTYRLLRYINSASSGVRREISTVRQAILMLGLSGMRKWATYCIMDKMGDVPSEEIRVSSTLRARLCELIAQQLKLEDRDSYSLMGSLSNLEPLMRVSLVDLLKELPLAPVLNSALLGDETTMHGRVLACVKAYELGDLSRADAWPLPLKAVRELYLEALTWVNELEMD
jgi:EAL and modified HD-GYP domain-containing signal transduction protein